MSTSISNAFIADYQSDVHLVFQRKGAALREAVRMKTNIVGSTTTFQVAGKGVATTKARHGKITPMNQDHTSVTATLTDLYAGDYVDTLDEAKTNINERMVIATSGAGALGRAADDQMLTAMDGTSESTITINVTTKANIAASMMEWSEALDSNDVPNDGERYGTMSPRLWAQVMMIDAFSNADYVGSDGLPYTTGSPGFKQWKDWNGIKWTVHSGGPGKGTATSKVFIWHKTAIGYATGKHADNSAENDTVKAIITYIGDRDSYFVNHKMSAGAVLIDSSGVIEGNLDDTADIVTS